MSHDHPQLLELTRFMRGKLTRDDNRRVVRHLLTGCDRCLHVTRRLWFPSRPATGEAQEVHPRSYLAIWQRALGEADQRRSARHAERERAQELLRELLDRSPGECLAAVVVDVRFRGFALAELLLQRCRETAEGAPEETIFFAELTLAVAERLEPGDPPGAIGRDLITRGWTLLACGRRRAGELPGARRAVEVAWSLLRQGTGDPIERAAVLLEKARLAAAAGDRRRGAGILGRVADLYRQAGEHHLSGEALIEAATLQATAGATAQAIRLLRRGLRRLDRTRPPQRTGEALQLLIRLLIEAGRAGEALLWLQQAELAAERRGDRHGRLLLLRLRGRAALATGRPDEAEAAFTEAQSGLSAAGCGREAILAALDLARLYTVERQPGTTASAATSPSDKLRRLSREITSLSGTSGIDLDTSAALYLIQRAAEEDRLTEGLVTQLTGYLERLRLSPPCRRQREPVM